MRRYYISQVYYIMRFNKRALTRTDIVPDKDDI